MKKQTAVEWLVEQIFGDHTSQWQKQINQAKAMEKEQIIKAVYYNCSSMSHSDLPCGEQYYNETFKSE